MGSRARYRILDDAEDEGRLWELLQPNLTVMRDGTRIESHQVMPVSEVRPALEELLRDEHLVLIRDSDYEHHLSLADALTAIADDTHWSPPGSEGRGDIYSVRITDSGDREYQIEYDAHHR